MSLRDFTKGGGPQITSRMLLLPDARRSSSSMRIGLDEPADAGRGVGRRAIFARASAGAELSRAAHLLRTSTGGGQSEPAGMAIDIENGLAARQRRHESAVVAGVYQPVFWPPERSAK